MARIILLLAYFLLLIIYIGQCTKLCSFESGNCDWDIRIPWNLVTIARMPAANFGGNNYIEIKSDGPFLLAQGKYGSILSSPTITQKLSISKHMRILAYRFHRKGSATLRIILERDSSSELLLLDAISSSEPETITWQRRSVLIPPIQDNARLVFECNHIRTSQDIIAIDDVDLATPENVIWSGKDSKLFDENDIRQRDIRRTAPKYCDALKCVFRSTSCNWRTSNIQKLPTKLVNEAVGESTLISEPVKVSSGSYLQIQIFDSAETLVTVSTRNIGSTNEKEIWRKKKSENTAIADNNGWEKIDIQLEDILGPVVFVIRTITGINDFVAFSSIDITDEKGNSKSCDNVPAPIQPNSDQLIRLTALQNMHMSPIESLFYQPPMSTSENPPLASLKHQFSTPSPLVSFSLDSSSNNLNNVDNFKPSSSLSPSAVLPISPAQVSARGVPIIPFAFPPHPLPFFQSLKLPGPPGVSPQSFKSEVQKG